jgi:hypothetical protein
VPKWFEPSADDEGEFVFKQHDDKGGDYWQTRAKKGFEDLDLW